MRSRRLGLGLVVFLAGLTTSAFADNHFATHVATRFIRAWNSHDSAEMATQWTVDATAVDVLGRVANGRAAAARLFTEGQSSIRLASAIAVQQQSAGVQTAEFDAEIVGMRSADGTVMPPFVRHFKAVMVWGADLPGGHHPKGRYFMASLR